MRETRKLTGLDVAGVSVALLLLGCLVAPALAAARSGSAERFCAMRLKQVLLALHNHHDTRRCFPLASSRPLPNAPGTHAKEEEEERAGRSWLLALMPFLDQARYYDAVVTTTKRFEQPLLDPDLKVTVRGVTRDGRRADWSGSPAEYQVPGLLCPLADPDASVEASPAYRGIEPAFASFHAFAGTHFYNREGVGRLLEPERIGTGFVYEGNGALVFPGTSKGRVIRKGLGFRSLADGTARTLVAAESKETATAAWIDGQAMWVVAAAPSHEPPRASPEAQVPNTLAWPGDPGIEALATRWEGSDVPPGVYLPAGRWSGPNDRKWGPSSNHPGAVAHGFADGHVEMITPRIDPYFYLAYVTRNGREPIPTDRGWSMPLAPQTPGRARRGIQRGEVPADWEPQVEWSPLKLGDLEIGFPSVLALHDFRPDARRVDTVVLATPSRVFREVTHRVSTGEFCFEVTAGYKQRGATGLFRQLNTALGEPSEKGADDDTKRITWRRVADWGEGEHRFVFTLEQPTRDDHPLLVRIVVSKQ